MVGYRINERNTGKVTLNSERKNSNSKLKYKFITKDEAIFQLHLAFRKLGCDANIIQARDLVIKFDKKCNGNFGDTQSMTNILFELYNGEGFSISDEELLALRNWQSGRGDGSFRKIAFEYF